MEKVEFEDAPKAVLSGKPDRRALDEALGAAEMAIKYYDLEPGEVFSGGYHTHHDQEEIFVILEGEAVWDTEDGEAALTVSAGEAIRFAPGEFQHGYVADDADEPVRALALGAPAGMDDTVSIFTCPSCGDRTEHDVDLRQDEGLSISTCRACGHEIRTEFET